MNLLVFLIFGLSLIGNTESKDNVNNCTHDAKAFRCVKYLKNYDGDTVTFEIPNVHPLLGHKISVRVNGLDTPEMRGSQPCEKQAARAAQKLMENLLKNAKIIHIENPVRDKYFRILGDVIVDGKSLSQILLKNKLAYEYSGQTKSQIDWCQFGQQRKTAGDK